MQDRIHTSLSLPEYTIKYDCSSVLVTEDKTRLINTPHQYAHIQRPISSLWRYDHPHRIIDCRWTAGAWSTPLKTRMAESSSTKSPPFPTPRNETPQNSRIGAYEPKPNATRTSQSATDHQRPIPAPRNPRAHHEIQNHLNISSSPSNLHQTASHSNKDRISGLTDKSRWYGTAGGDAGGPVASGSSRDRGGGPAGRERARASALLLGGEADAGEGPELGPAPVVWRPSF
jgi:hypothetical protein